MKCPRCVQASLSPTQYEGVTIDRCASCGGAWLDLGEIERINRTAEVKFTAGQIAETLKSSTAGVPASEQSSVELCPKCSVPMQPLNFNYSSGIVIDSCPARHGLWFDAQELERTQMHWEHWEAQRKANSGAWGLQAQAAKIEAMADQDHARARNQQQYGSIGQFLDRILHGIEKARRTSG